MTTPDLSAPAPAPAGVRYFFVFAALFTCLWTSLMTPVGGWASGGGVIAEVGRLLGVSIIAGLFLSRRSLPFVAFVIWSVLMSVWWGVVAKGVWVFATR